MFVIPNTQNSHNPIIKQGSLIRTFGKLFRRLVNPKVKKISLFRRLFRKFVIPKIRQVNLKKIKGLLFRRIVKLNTSRRGSLFLLKVH